VDPSVHTYGDHVQGKYDQDADHQVTLKEPTLFCVLSQLIVSFDGLGVGKVTEFVGGFTFNWLALEGCTDGSLDIIGIKLASEKET